jgi:type II secretory pathway pseudopilin PulG
MSDTRYKIPNTKYHSGFTLVELLIYMGIFAIAATTITGILITTVRVQNQEVASTEVTQQLNFVLNNVQRLVGQSSEVEKTYEGTDPNAPCTTFCTLKLRMLGDKDPTLISSDANGVYLKQGSGAQTLLTNSQIKVNNIKFTIYSTTGGHATVQVNASFSYNSTNPQLAITKTLQSAVGRVSAATFDSSLLPDTNSSRDIGQTNPDLRWNNIYLAGLLGFGSSASDPTALAAGSVYYNTTSNKLRIWNGTVWGDISPFVGGTNTAYYTGGNVGIGTAAPAAALDVQQGVTAATGVGTGVNLAQTLTAAANNDRLTALKINPTFVNGSYTGVNDVALDVTGQLYSRLYTLTWAATTAIDWSNGNTQKVTLAGATTFTFANGQAGGKYTLVLVQDATGNRTVTWPASVKWSGGTAPTLTTTGGKTDFIGFIYDGANYYGVGSATNF